jgi:hypothetical protein
LALVLLGDMGLSQHGRAFSVAVDASAGDMKAGFEGAASRGHLRRKRAPPWYACRRVMDLALGTARFVASDKRGT